MRWPWHREPPRLNGHAHKPGGPVTNGHPVVLTPSDFPLIPLLTLIPVPAPIRRADRHADDNYASERIGMNDLLAIARRAQAVTGRPQRIHNHPEGHLCTARCSILDDPQEAI